MDLPLGNPPAAGVVLLPTDELEVLAAVGATRVVVVAARVVVVHQLLGPLAQRGILPAVLHAAFCRMLP